jgi:hypothetical protein
METSYIFKIDSYRQPQIYFTIQNVHDTYFWISLSVQNRPKELSPTKKIPNSVIFTGMSAASGTRPVLGQPGLHVGKMASVRAALAPRVNTLDYLVAYCAGSARRVAMLALHLFLGQWAIARGAVHKKIGAVVVQLVDCRYPTQFHQL